MTAARRPASAPRRVRSVEAGVFAAAMVAFALCAHRPALAVPRFAALAVAVGAFGLSLVRARRPMRMLGLTRPRPPQLAWFAVSLAAGAALAVWYRHLQGRPVRPVTLTWFAFPAAAIGLTEEFAYRGYLQGALRRYGVLLACAAAAMAHTAYKRSLFAFPDVPIRAEAVTLTVGTLGFGFLFGLLREGSGGLAAPAAAHVAFDIVAYGDLPAAPWWVL